jgi:hypothetical protein
LFFDCFKEAIKVANENYNDATPSIEIIDMVKQSTTNN